MTTFTQDVTRQLVANKDVTDPIGTRQLLTGHVAFRKLMISREMPVPKFGDLLMFNADAFFSKLQHLFTRRWIRGVSPKSFGPGNRSHVAYCVGDVCGEISLFDVKEKVVIDPWTWSNAEPHRIYRYKADEGTIAMMMHELYVQDTDQWYKTVWLLYYPYRRLVEALFSADVRKMKPWVPQGVVCSQSGWLGTLIMCKLMGWQDMLDYLNEWDSNNFNASDMQSVIDAFPQYIELVNEYNLPT
jgi:hypothetical protein